MVQPDRGELPRGFSRGERGRSQDPDVFTVIFFDEVDSIGSMRGESVHRIDDRVLNAFMAELSGLEERGNVVVVSATNLLSVLTSLWPATAGWGTWC